MKSSTVLDTHERALAKKITDLSNAGVAGISGELRQLRDAASASLIEVWFAQTERRTWFLSQIISGS